MQEPVYQMGMRCAETRQVVRRLYELLPDRLEALKKHIQTTEKLGSLKAQRKALLDERYLKAIDEILVVSEEALLVRLQWEKSLMQTKARQSGNFTR